MRPGRRNRCGLQLWHDPGKFPGPRWKLQLDRDGDLWVVSLAVPVQEMAWLCGEKAQLGNSCSAETVSLFPVRRGRSRGSPTPRPRRCGRDSKSPIPHPSPSTRPSSCLLTP